MKKVEPGYTFYLGNNTRLEATVGIKVSNDNESMECFAPKADSTVGGSYIKGQDCFAGSPFVRRGKRRSPPGHVSVFGGLAT
jgi:hypothetical protein